MNHMPVENNRQSNVDRFLGFQELYDRHRPHAPLKVPELLIHYLGGPPSLVVDVGCGTGLSTFVWKERAQQVVGVEPNPDMLSKAEEKLHLLPSAGTSASISFRQGYSNALGLADGSADIITCSQSFHWMEPVSTLREFSRVLRDGGIFAAYDCDWPPAIGWEAEEAYLLLIAQSEQLLRQLVKEDEAAMKLDKEEHLARMRQSGVFRFTREIVFHHEEPCDSERLFGLALSQGNIQTVIKRGAVNGLEQELEDFRRLLDKSLGGETVNILFSYRLRLGVK
ncbi:MAG: SAM-dependent methyltransferase [Paenibacillaceae bacterium]|jgi:ubiquinone/menaquinone biosynthesis C-methylase UbiE|nr:SAM-dependent methyltransferase [Paenibacillaceae bacterium]